MQLITKELEKKLPKINAKTSDDSRVLVHYFNPTGRGDWFGLTYDAKTRTYFGYVSLFGDWNDELGYFSLDELESVDLPFGLKIERDLYWDDTQTLADIRQRYTHN